MEWYKCFRHNLCGATLNWIKDKFEQGNPFDNKGDDFEKNFKKIVGGADTPASSPERKEEPAKKPEEEKKIIKPQPAKRDPVTNKTSKSIDCMYYVGETLNFEGDDVKMSLAFNLLRSENTNIIIKGKFKGM